MLVLLFDGLFVIRRRGCLRRRFHIGELVEVFRLDRVLLVFLGLVLFCMLLLLLGRWRLLLVLRHAHGRKKCKSLHFLMLTLFLSLALALGILGLGLLRLLLFLRGFGCLLCLLRLCHVGLDFFRLLNFLSFLWLRCLYRDVLRCIDIYRHHIGQIETNLVLVIDDFKSAVDKHLVASDALNLTRVNRISRLLKVIITLDFLQKHRHSLSRGHAHAQIHLGEWKEFRFLFALN